MFSAGHSAEPVPEFEPAVDSGAVSEAVEEAGEVAFVTETMAEVYLQQGHLEAALDIYQKLAEQRPGDELLRERMLAVADAIHDASAATAQSDVQSAAYAPYDDGADDVVLEGHEEGAAVGPTIREFLSGILQPRSFVAAQDLIERESTPLSSVALDATAFDDSIFDTSAYGDAPSLGETAMYPTPASGLTPAYGGTPAHPDTPADKPTLGYGLESLQDAPLADAGPTDAAAVKGPTFEEAPQEAATLEIDLSSADFASPESAAASTDSFASIDEEFGADSNDWPPGGAGVESAALESSDAVEQPSEPVSAAPPAASRPTPSSLDDSRRFDRRTVFGRRRVDRRLDGSEHSRASVRVGRTRDAAASGNAGASRGGRAVARPRLQVEFRAATGERRRGLLVRSVLRG